MLMRKFGSVPVYGANNVFIGGVASTINTPALIADKFLNYPSLTPILETDIHNFTINGNDIEFNIDIDYKIKDEAFYVNTNVTYYVDNLHCKFVGLRSLYNFGVDSKLKYISLLECLEIDQDGISGFSMHSKLEQINLPKAINVLNSGNFRYNERLRSLYIPLVTNFGFSIDGNQQCLENLPSARIYLNDFVATNNSGGEDADVVRARTFYSTIVYASMINTNLPNVATNLSIGNVYSTAIQLFFTDATINVNDIDYYEVWINGKYNGLLNKSGDYVTNLNPNTINTIQLKTVDIYYNKSVLNSASITQTTSGTTTFIDSLIQYYKTENNVLDSWGGLKGIPFNITYETGTIGKRAIMNGTSSRFIVPHIPMSNEISIVMRLKRNVASSTTQKSGLSLINANVDNTHYPLSGIIYLSTFNSARVDCGAGIVDLATEHTFVVTANKNTNVWKFYQGDVLVKTATVGTLSPITLPQFGKGAASFYFEGRQDEIAIFKKELTQSEITEINNTLNSGQSLI